MRIDPRTVAREIPGILTEIFPQLTSGIVGYFNSTVTTFGFRPILKQQLITSKLQKAMLFELGYVAAEQLLENKTIDWSICIASAVDRQRSFYDAKIPDNISDVDKDMALAIGLNLSETLTSLALVEQSHLISNPIIPGLEWIATGKGDYAIKDILIEVKCTNHNFSSSDYRQVAMYWLLSFASSLEGQSTEWREVILLNPRLGKMVRLQIDKFLHIISSGRTKIDILQLFITMIGTRLTR